MKIMFGPSGNSNSFYDEGFNSSLQMPKWLSDKGLDAYEYNCTKGVRISKETASLLGKNALDNNIFLSIHGQYYISLTSENEEIRNKSVMYIIESLKCADYMGAKRIVIHPGGCGKLTREDALFLAKATLKNALDKADEMGLSHINICPETMGKQNQLGTVSEIIELCKLDERLIPTIDFGHINARSLGSIKTKKDYEDILNEFENGLGFDRIKSFHSHFSKIEYTKGGEKKHLTFKDEIFGPFFDPLAEVIYKKGLTPVIICESDGTMAEDAKTMKNIYEKVESDFE